MYKYLIFLFLFAALPLSAQEQAATKALAAKIDAAIISQYGGAWQHYQSASETNLYSSYTPAQIQALGEYKGRIIDKLLLPWQLSKPAKIQTRMKIMKRSPIPDNWAGYEAEHKTAVKVLAAADVMIEELKNSDPARFHAAILINWYIFMNEEITPRGELYDNANKRLASQKKRDEEAESMKGLSPRDPEYQKYEEKNREESNRLYGNGSVK